MSVTIGGHARDYLTFQTGVFSGLPSIRGNAGPDYYPIGNAKADANQTRSHRPLRRVPQ